MAFTTRLSSVLRGLLLVAVAGAASAAEPASSQADLVARGRYLATAADCVACHTAPGGRPMAGGLPIDSPFGKIFSSNITPSRTHGIGNYSEAEFARAVREGVNARGAHLYPAMPYTAYAGVADGDIQALYAYFMHGVAPVDTAPPATQLAFPFSQRWLMFGWNLLFLDRQRFEASADKSPQWNRGKYLVNTVGHCGACHSPRNVLMAEKQGLALSGGQVGPWRAPNITSDPISGVGGWSVQELAQYLRTGAVAGKGQAAGGMAEAIQDSLQHLSAEDLTAIAVYLKDSPPVRNAADTQAAFSFGGHATGYEAGLRAVNTGIGYQQPGLGYAQLTTGAQLYSANCASCHQTTGRCLPEPGPQLHARPRQCRQPGDGDPARAPPHQRRCGEADAGLWRCADRCPGGRVGDVRHAPVRQSRRNGGCRARQGTARGRSGQRCAAAPLDGVGDARRHHGGGVASRLGRALPQATPVVTSCRDLA